MAFSLTLISYKENIINTFKALNDDFNVNVGEENINIKIFFYLKY